MTEEQQKFLRDAEVFLANHAPQRIAEPRGVNGGSPQKPPATFSLVESVKRQVAQKHGVTVAELEGVRRTSKIAIARQEAYWRLHVTGKMTLPQIGRTFNKDHTTIYHGIKKAKQRMEAAHG